MSRFFKNKTDRFWRELGKEIVKIAVVPWVYTDITSF